MLPWPFPATWYWSLDGLLQFAESRLRGWTSVSGGWQGKPGIWNQMCRTVDSGFLDRWGYIFSASFYLLFWCFPNILQQTCISFVIKKLKIFKKLKRIWNRIFFLRFSDYENIWCPLNGNYYRINKTSEKYEFGAVNQKQICFTSCLKILSLRFSS